MSMPMQKLVRPAQYKRPDFAAAYAKAIFRYKIDAGIFPTFAFRDSKVVRVLSADDIDDGTKAPAISFGGDLEYVVPVTIGTPGVELNLDFDTGSSDLWIFSTELKAAQHLRGHHFYDPKRSTTAHKDPISHWEIHYGDGSFALGDVWTDTVTIGDIAISKQAIELATKVSSSFLVDGGNDGLLGLGFGNINTVQPRPVQTPMENMLNQHLLAKPVFSCKLGRGEESEGYYSFGYIDPEAEDALTYTPIDPSGGWWQVPSTSYAINGRKTRRPGNACILDTGTTLTLVDDTVLSHIYGAIQGAVFDHREGGWKYPARSRVPEISFAVGDKLYKINPKDLAYGEPMTDGYVFGGIQSRGNNDVDIFGDCFLKSVYVVFDQGNNTVGLVQRDD